MTTSFENGDQFCKELKKILKDIPVWESFFQLFNFDPNVYFYVKNRQKKFLWMNHSLRNLHGIKETFFLGKTDYDYSSQNLALLFQLEDESVFESRKPVINRPWIVNNQFGQYHWYLSSKVPLIFGRKIMGLAGIMRSVTNEIIKNPLNEMKEAVDFIFHHYSERINVEDLAAMSFLSVSQFERKFFSIFQMTPSTFILKVRIDASVRMLIEGDDSITKVALQCGFFDNSHFTRYFRQKIGMTPLQFRKMQRDPNKKRCDSAEQVL